MANIKSAKITRTEIRSSLKRSKALCLLSAATNRPLVWIAAPAGSGKSTLVSSYLEQRESPCLWYQIDESDADPASFFYYTKLAAKNIASANVESLPLLTPEYTHGLSTFARRYLEYLAAILQEATESQKTGREYLEPGNPCLVLDNYQDLPENSILHSLLASGLERLPRGVNAIIISRHHPPAQYSRLRAAGLISLLGWQEIKFSLQETRELLRTLLYHAGMLEMQDCDAKSGLVHKITDGWAAGVVLLAESLKWNATDALHLDRNHPPEEIIDYFAYEVCASIDEDILDFLIRTSFLPHMTSYTAQAVSGNRHAAGILSELYLRNIFTERRELKPLVYKYHPLFRQFLLGRAQKIFSLEHLQELQERAAELMAKTGQTDEAVELLLSCGRHDAAAGMILRKAESMVARGREKTLETWIRRLPSSMHHFKPWLHYWQGVCRHYFCPSEALIQFQEAFDAFIAENNKQGALAAWCGAVESILLERGDFRLLDAWVDWLHERLDQGLCIPDRDLEARITACMIGTILFRHPGHPNACAWLAKAEEIACEAWSPESIMRMSYLIMYHLLFGDTGKAGMLIRRMQPFITTSTPPFMHIKWYLIRAMHANMARGEGKEAVFLAEEGLALARETGIHTFDMYLLAQGVHGSLISYNQHSADHYLQAMSASISDGRLWDVSNYHYLSAWKEWCRGDVRAFSEHLQAALHLVEKIGCTLSCAVGYAGMALISLENNRMEEVGELLDKARMLIPGNNDTLEFVYLLIEALAFFRNWKEQEGASLLARALSIGRGHGFFTAPFWKKETMSLICAKALEHGIETEYVHELISKGNLSPLPGKDRELTLMDWPFPLKIFALGGFNIQLNGQPLQFGKKRRNKPLELLKVLIACGSSGIPNHKISDLLYPDFDGDRANYSFKFTLNQLRTLLGSSSFLICRGGTLSLNEHYCFIDAEVFLQLCNRIKRLHNSDSINSAHGKKREQQDYLLFLCHKALDLYRGDFLYNDDANFAVAPREMFRSRFLGLVDISGAVLTEEGRDYEAMNLYEKAIELDVLQERFYRRLMHCYARQGEEAAAISVYRRCQRVLGSKLGVKPSAETRNTYNALIQS